MENQLTKLFEKRDKQFEETTVEIIENLEDVTTAIEEFMVATGIVTTEEVVWTEVGLMSPDGMLVLIGFAFLSPGQMFTTNEGETVTITEENDVQFRRLLRVGIPMNIASEGDKEKVLEFLRKKAEENKEAYAEIEDQLQEVSEPESRQDYIDGFDLEQLTEEQKKALEMFTPVGNTLKDE